MGRRRDQHRPHVCSATCERLPSTISFNPLRPLEPITITAESNSSATSTMPLQVGESTSKRASARKPASRASSGQAAPGRRWEDEALSSSEQRPGDDDGSARHLPSRRSRSGSARRVCGRRYRRSFGGHDQDRAWRMFGDLVRDASLEQLAGTIEPREPSTITATSISSATATIPSQVGASSSARASASEPGRRAFSTPARARCRASSSFSSLNAAPGKHRLIPPLSARVPQLLLALAVLAS